MSEKLHIDTESNLYSAAHLIAEMFAPRLIGETPDEKDALVKEDAENIYYAMRRMFSSPYGYRSPDGKTFWRNIGMSGESRVTVREQKWIPLWAADISLLEHDELRAKVETKVRDLRAMPDSRVSDFASGMIAGYKAAASEFESLLANLGSEP